MGLVGRRAGRPQYSLDEISPSGKVLAETWNGKGSMPNCSYPKPAGRSCSDRNYLNAARRSGLGPHLSLLAVHSYWSTGTPHGGARKMKEYPHVRLWMTGGAKCEELRPGDGSGSQSVPHDHADLTWRASSWQFWLAVSRHDYRDGLCVTPDYRVGRPGVLGDGQLRRFIRPGARRVDVRTSAPLRWPISPHGRLGLPAGGSAHRRDHQRTTTPTPIELVIRPIPQRRR